MYLVGWRAAVERGRALEEQQMIEGLVFACASERMAPASARRRLVRAVRNMVEEVWGDGVMGFGTIGKVEQLPATRHDASNQTLRVAVECVEL